jgi:hypothetical protein
MENGLSRILRMAREEIQKRENILKDCWLKFLDFCYIPDNPRHRE